MPNVDLTPREVQVAIAALAGEFPPAFDAYRMPLLRKFARAALTGEDTPAPKEPRQEADR